MSYTTNALVQKIARKRDIPRRAWVWCDEPGWDHGWWLTTSWWDKYTIGSLTHWHPPQEKPPNAAPPANEVKNRPIWP